MNLDRKIPWIDFQALYADRMHRFEEATQRIIRSGWYIGGPEVEGFENAFRDYLGSGFVVGCANGTDAIELALRAAEIGPGDAVLAPSHTAVATISAIERAGALPCLLDLAPPNGGLDIDKLESVISRAMKTHPIKALIAVHLYGFPLNLPRLRVLCDRYKLILIEDCAQAHGARFDGQMVGTWGDYGTFSFYPTKNLGALGDGGATWARTKEQAERLRVIREYGWTSRYRSTERGINSRLDPIQAACLKINLEYLDADNARRREIARSYDSIFDQLRIRHGKPHSSSLAVYHQYPVLVPDREALVEYLNSVGIPTAVLYPEAVHQQPAYNRKLPLYPEYLTATEDYLKQLLCFPVSPSVKTTDLTYIAEKLHIYYQSRENPVSESTSASPGHHDHD